MRTLSSGQARILVYVTAVLVVLVDQATKYLIQSSIPLYESIPVIEGLFNITHVRNPGAAFGLLAGASSTLRFVFLVVLTLAIIGIIVVYLEKHRSAGKTLTTGLTLILGGALGNLVDRLSHGEVIDFLDFHIGSWHWPAFNVADAAITVGAFLLIIDMMRGRESSSS
ncbi:MAG: signal peptidase II [Syntrophales bacterium]|nr:signal peptidase II [Syntrophales bacterium]